jgi:hypothetical protein
MFVHKYNMDANKPICKRKKTYFICGAYELMELRISVTTMTAIKFGLQHNSRDRLKKVQSVAELLTAPHNAKPDDFDTSQVRGDGEYAGFRCQFEMPTFFLQVSFQMPTRLYLTVFFGLQVSFEMPTFFT